MYPKQGEIEMKKDEIIKLEYPIGMTLEQMLHFRNLYEFYRKNFPFIPESLSQLMSKIRDVIEDGCFIHKRKLVMFKPSENESIRLCPECSPKEYQEMKSKYKEYKL